MFDQLYEAEQVWNTQQEPVCPAYMPSPCWLLLSALDSGWRIVKYELAPCWDQNGLVYLVSLQQNSGNGSQRLILPNTPRVENLIHEYAFGD